MGRRRTAWLINGTGVRDGRPGYYVRWREPDPAGGPDACPSRHFHDHQDAADFVFRKNRERDAADAGRIVAIRVSAAGPEFIGSCGSLKPSTLKDYRMTIANFHAVTSDPYVHDIDGAMMDRWMATQKKSQATAARKWRGMHAFLNWCVARGYHTGPNPAADVTSKPRGDHARERPAVSREQFIALFRAIPATGDKRLMCWLELTTGIDRDRLENMRPERFDIENRCITMKRPKTGKINSVPIHSALVPILSRKLRRADPLQPLLRGVKRRKNKKLDWWHRAASAAGVPGLLFRDLRAFATRRVIDAGGGLADAMRLLGHGSIETTARHYHAPDPAVAKRASSLPLPGLRRKSTAKRRKHARRARRAS